MSVVYLTVRLVKAGFFPQWTLLITCAFTFSTTARRGSHLMYSSQHRYVSPCNFLWFAKSYNPLVAHTRRNPEPPFILKPEFVIVLWMGIKRTSVIFFSVQTRNWTTNWKAYTFNVLWKFSVVLLFLPPLEIQECANHQF